MELDTNHVDSSSLYASPPGCQSLEFSNRCIHSQERHIKQTDFSSRRKPCL
jgi:hypothetical protein